MATVMSTRSLFFTWPENFQPDFYPELTYTVRGPAKRTAFATKHSRSNGSITEKVDGPVKPEKRSTKSVHFADSKGLALVTVLTFNVEKELQEEFSRYLTLSQKQCGESNSSTCTAKETSSPEPKGEGKRKETQLISAKTIAERVDFQKVCLEKTEVLDNVIKGTVCVHNLAYHKSVGVKYTFDDWKTQNRVEGVFHNNTGEIDRFVFEISMTDEIPCAETKNFKVQFAICYTVLGDSFWDNNNGSNYHVLLARS